MNSIFKEYPEVITIEQLQEMLLIGRNTAYQLLKTGSIKSVKTSKSGKYIILKKHVEEYLTNQNSLCYNENLHVFNRIAL